RSKKAPSRGAPMMSSNSFFGRCRARSQTCRGPPPGLVVTRSSRTRIGPSAIVGLHFTNFFDRVPPRDYSRSPEAGMDWQKELDELRRREEFAERLGGPERVKRQHDGGRYTIPRRSAPR